MSTQNNPYFRLRDRSLRKAEKHYRRAVWAHYHGIWLDQINDMSKRQHEDIKYMHDEWTRIEQSLNEATANLKQITKNLRKTIKDKK